MKPLQKSPLTPHERIKRLYYILFGATILVGVANLTYLVMQPDWTIKNVAFCALQYFVVFALLIVPVVLQRKYLINIPLVLIVAIALFAFVAMIMVGQRFAPTFRNSSFIYRFMDRACHLYGARDAHIRQ